MDAIKTEVYNILETAIRAAITAGELSITKVPNIPFSPHEDPGTPAISPRQSHWDSQNRARMAPRKIAEIIVKHTSILKHTQLSTKSTSQAQGFYKRFISPMNGSMTHSRTIAAMQSRYGTSDKGAGKHLQIEFVSANPTGPLNIVSGRARSGRGYPRQSPKHYRL